MSISTRNTHRPGGNQTNRSNNLQNNTAPRANNFFRSTGRPNFVTEEHHHQEDQQNFVAHENECQEEQPQKLVNDSNEIHDTENIQLKRDEINLNNIGNSPELPHIITLDPPLKILIDSGASSSIMNPSIANKLFPNCIFFRQF